MKALIFGDVHITNKNPKYHRDDRGVSDLLLAQYEFFKWLKSLTGELSIDIIIFTGDLTDYPTMDPLTLTYCNKMLRELVDTGVHLIFIEGNHCISDRARNFTVIGALSELISEENCHFVFQDEMVQIENHRFYCYPYHSDYGGLENKISSQNEKLDKEYNNIMLFHFPCSNAMLDNGIKSVKGVHLTDEIAGNFDMVWGGDYHTHQSIEGHHYAYYVGAPFDLKNGEHQLRAVVALDLDTKGFERIENPYNIKILDMTQEEFKDAPEDLIRTSVIRVTDSDELFEEYLKGVDTYRTILMRKSVKRDRDLDAVKLIDKKNYKNVKKLIEFYVEGSKEVKDKALTLFEKIKD